MNSLRDIYTQSLVNKKQEIEKENKKTKLWPLVSFEIFLIILFFYLLYQTGFKPIDETKNIILFYNFSYFEVLMAVIILFAFLLIIIWGIGLNNLFKNIGKAFADRKVITQFICPHCLKSILLEKLNFECPFCNEIYDSNAFLNIAMKEQILFDKCNKCSSKIRYIECYNCNNSIDLFAPYNQEELEAKRYE